MEKFHEWPVCLLLSEVAQDVDDQKYSIELVGRDALAVGNPGEDGDERGDHFLGMVEAVADGVPGEPINGGKFFDDFVDGLIRLYGRSTEADREVPAIAQHPFCRELH